MLFVATAFVLESDVLKAVAVILIGCSALVLAALGKPKQTPVDLTDRLYIFFQLACGEPQ